MVALASLAASAQESREQEATGASAKLPEGWEWKSKFGDSISMQLKLDVKGRAETATAELYTSPGRFVGARIDEILHDVNENEAGHKRVKVKERSRFAKQKNVVLISYVKLRGADGEREYDRRHWLWRAHGILFEWREEVRKEAASKAGRGFSAAQRGLSFSLPKGRKPRDAVRDFVNQRVKYKIGSDWEWQRGEAGKKVRLPGGQQLLFTARTETLIKGQRALLGVGLQCFTTGATPKQVMEANHQGLRKDWKDVEDFEIKEKVPFRGEKAVVASWTGINKNLSDRTRFFSQWFVFKHKRNVFLWNELGPAKAKRTGAKQLKAARKALSTY